MRADVVDGAEGGDEVAAVWFGEDVVPRAVGRYNGIDDEGVCWWGRGVRG